MALLIMPLEEILAEKIRALHTRQKARDLYDIVFFIKKGAKLDRGQIITKLDYYNIEPDISSITNAIESKRALWAKEMKSLVGGIIDFDDAKDTLLLALSGIGLT